MSRRTCIAKNKEGGVCKAPPMKESEYCFFHDPDATDAASAARRASRISGSEEKWRS